MTHCHPHLQLLSPEPEKELWSTTRTFLPFKGPKKRSEMFSPSRLPALLRPVAAGYLSGRHRLESGAEPSSAFCRNLCLRTPAEFIFSVFFSSQLLIDSVGPFVFWSPRQPFHWGSVYTFTHWTQSAVFYPVLTIGQSQHGDSKQPARVQSDGREDGWMDVWMGG